MINFFSSRRVKVLLVNSDRQEADKFAGFLPEDKYCVYTAFTGAAGIALAEKEQPGIIIMDCELPGKSGWETLNKLKNNVNTAAIPVLMRTAAGDDASASRAYSGRAEGCIPGPARKETVMARIERRLGRARELAAR